MSIKAFGNDVREVYNRKVACSRLQDSGKGRSKNIPGKFEKRIGAAQTSMSLQRDI